MNTQLIVDCQNQIELKEEKNVWTVGRGKNCDICIPDNTVSKMHLQLTRFNESFFITDLNSRNGTFLNGKRVSTPTKLSDKDVLTIGKTEITFKTGCSAEDTFDSIDEGTSIIQERMLTTVLVVDIKQYGKLSRSLGEEKISSILSVWTKNCSTIVTAANATEHKFIGDALMAIWVHDEFLERREVIRILRALNLIVEHTAALQSMFKLSNPVEIGAGINTGYAVVGNTGTKEAPDFSAIGPSVDMAFRIESATRQHPVDLFIGKGTYDRVKLPFQPYQVSIKELQDHKVFGTTFSELKRCLLTQ